MTAIIVSFKSRKQRATEERDSFYIGMSQRIVEALTGIGIPESEHAKFIAQKSGLDRRTAARLVTGKLVQPYSAYLALPPICEATGVSFNWIFDPSWPKFEATA